MQLYRLLVDYFSLKTEIVADVTKTLNKVLKTMREGKTCKTGITPNKLNTNTVIRAGVSLLICRVSGLSLWSDSPGSRKTTLLRREVAGKEACSRRGVGGGGHVTWRCSSSTAQQTAAHAHRAAYRAAAPPLQSLNSTAPEAPLIHLHSQLQMNGAWPGWAGLGWALGHVCMC